MTTTHGDNATTWRDLTDQLTTEQARKLAGIERVPVGYYINIGPPMSQSEIQANLLMQARGYAGDNLAGALYAEVPDPAGALHVSDWFDWSTDGALRYFSGRRWVIDVDNTGEAIDVVVDGSQLSNGDIERMITISDKSEEGMTNWKILTPQQARQFAARLIEAAAMGLMARSNVTCARLVLLRLAPLHRALMRAG
jgi:hypothetical protein